MNCACECVCMCVTICVHVCQCERQREVLRGMPGQVDGLWEVTRRALRVEDTSQDSYHCGVSQATPAPICPGQRSPRMCLPPPVLPISPLKQSLPLSHGVSATGFAMHPPGLSLALTLDFPPSVPRQQRAGVSAPSFWFSVFPLSREGRQEAPAGCYGDEVCSLTWY